MTIGSPRRFFSNSRGRVTGRREASAGVWMFGCALICDSASRLSVGVENGVVDEAGAAHAGRDGDEHLAVDARHGGEVVRADELEVVGLDAAPAHRGERGGAQDLGVALAGA